MIEQFHFEDGGRTYKCNVEQPRGDRSGSWWWFAVTGDQHRYAPFQAASDDTEATVRSRISEYYRELLERRAQPSPPRSHWARRSQQGRPPAAAPAQAQQAKS